MSHLTLVSNNTTAANTAASLAGNPSATNQVSFTSDIRSYVRAQASSQPVIGAPRAAEVVESLSFAA